jgi:hypothetical protein
MLNISVRMQADLELVLGDGVPDEAIRPDGSPQPSMPAAPRQVLEKKLQQELDKLMMLLDRSTCQRAHMRL